MDDSDQPVRPLFTFGPGMRAMLLVALCFACYGIFFLLANTSKLPWLSPSLADGDPFYFSWIANDIFSILAFAVPAIVYANIFPQERFGYFRLQVPVSWNKILFAVIIMLFLPFVINQLLTWINNSVTSDALLEYKKLLDEHQVWASQMPTVGFLLLRLFASGLIPALCEELFFRAGIQQVLSENARNKHVSVVTTALLFTFFHQDPIGFPVIFLGGLILGYAFHWSSSLRLTVLMHFLFNGTSILWEYLEQHNAAVQAWTPGIPEFLVGTAVCGTFMFFLWKARVRRVEL